MTVAQALSIYANEHAAGVKDPARIAYAIEALVPFWGELPVAAIRRETCKAYGRQRRKVTKRDKATGAPIETTPVSAGTVRKELGTLAAAINYCAEEGYLINPPKVHLPERPAPKDRWLERHEAARLLHAARRNPESRHIARFILVGLYTGTRKTAILRLRFMPHLSGGHIDLERAMMYRRSAAQAESKKRQPPVPIPRELMRHLRRWSRNDARFLIEHRGQGVSDIKTAWATVVREAGLEGTGVTPHTLRHTAITWAMQAKGDIYQCAGYFGVNIETMFKVYAHHHPDYQQDAVRAIGRGGRKL